MPKTFLVRKFLHQQQLLEEQAQQRQSSVITSVDACGNSIELDLAKDLTCNQQSENILRNSVISSSCSDHEDDQPLSLTVHDRNVDGDGQNKVSSSSPTTSNSRPAYLPVSVIQTVPQVIPPKPSEDGPLDYHVPRVTRNVAAYDNVEHPGNANPVSPTPGSPYRSYDEINRSKSNVRLSPSIPTSFYKAVLPNFPSPPQFSPQSPPETSRMHVVSPIQSPAQATYKFVQSPPAHVNPQSPPQTAIIQPLSPPNSFEIRQKNYLHYPDSTLQQSKKLEIASESKKNIRPRSPSPCFRHKKHCAPNKAPRVSSPTINSSSVCEKNPLIRQALTSPPLANIADNVLEARSSISDASSNKEDHSPVQNIPSAYCHPLKQQAQVRSPLNTLPPNDISSKVLFQPQDHRISTTTTSKEDSQVPLLPVRLSILQQRLGLPEDAQVEFVNGGHGIKNPLINQSQAVTTPYSQKSIDHNETMEKNNQNQFVCKVCSKAFSLQRLLNRHMKCHSDVKRYLCTFCGKGFNDTFDLKRHTRTHTGVRPYKCNMCEKSFTQRCSLESHTLKVHGMQHNYGHKERRNKVYVCEECGHTTNEPEVHFIHLKNKHPYSPALLKFYDKRHFKFSNSTFPTLLLQGRA